VGAHGGEKKKANTCAPAGANKSTEHEGQKSKDMSEKKEPKSKSSEEKIVCNEPEGAHRGFPTWSR